MAILLIHGGAGNIDIDLEPAYLAGLAAAADAGYAALERGDTAVEAALVAVGSMEGNRSAFNAGIGGAPTREGTVELDAAVMASDGSSGAVACVRNSVHPARLADLVRTATPHALLAAHGAEALEQDPVPNDTLLTPRTRAALERWRAGSSGPTGSATVGAVALGDAGDMAAVTSTGGVLGQWSGRIGDSPIVGAGTYATENLAVSCTGHGEAFMRAVAARRVAEALEAGMELVDAVQAALDGVKRHHGTGGLIALTSEGRWAVGHTTPAMAYAWRSYLSRHDAVGRVGGVLVRGRGSASG